MEHKNFLLGRGERLTRKIDPPKRKQDKHDVYTLDETKKRISEMKNRCVSYLTQLPIQACPENQSVLILTLHPSYIAKSFNVNSLLNELSLRVVGSKSIKITPEKWHVKKHGSDIDTIALFVAGKRQNLISIFDFLGKLTETDPLSKQIIRIEEIRPFLPYERIKNADFFSKSSNVEVEIVVHSSYKNDGDMLLSNFYAYVEGIGGTINTDNRFQVDGLAFLRANIAGNKVSELEKYSFLRVVRPLPYITAFDPILRDSNIHRPFEVSIPHASPLSQNIHAAIFDGGLVLHDELIPYVNSYDLVDGVVDSLQVHGTAVTSAALFGPLIQDKDIQIPVASIDHFKVLGGASSCNDTFSVLDRIMSVLTQKKYDFINFSLGPNLSIDDDEVHAWTSVLDEFLSDGSCLSTIAAGNSGLHDWDSGNARVQVPSDCVNALSVGAANSKNISSSQRAKYSSIGPGRFTGIVKPDVLAFGGCDDEPFFSIGAEKGSIAKPFAGTSFAAPFIMNTSMRIRYILGEQISFVGIKALLIHRAMENPGVSFRECGWGHVNPSTDDLLLCDDNEVTIMYQGRLDPAHYIRANVPLPKTGIEGKVKISATFCYFCGTSPENPENYTDSGLDITFRSSLKKDDSKTASLFKKYNKYLSESQQRRLCAKWETVMSGTASFYGTSLIDSAFDIHYIPRDGVGVDKAPRPIPYALVLTLQAKNDPKLYNKIFTQYRTTLEVMRPIQQIPIAL